MPLSNPRQNRKGAPAPRQTKREPPPPTAKEAAPTTSIEDFISSAIDLAERADRGDKIAEAARGGIVQTDQYVRKVDALEDERLREYAREVVFGVWNEQKRDAKLDEIFHGVRRKIASDLENGEWPRIWNAYPIKRTVDRRVNELADSKHPRFWGEQGFPWCVSLRPGFYRPNPRLFSDETRADIARAAEKVA